MRVVQISETTSGKCPIGERLVVKGKEFGGAKKMSVERKADANVLRTPSG